MKIHLIWQIDPESRQDQRATTLTGIISLETKLALFPGHALHRMEDWEGFTFEASGLTHELPEEGSANFRFTPQVCSKLHMVKQTLQKHGVNAEIMVDGWSLLQYATQQESRLRDLQVKIEYCVNRLKATRSWIKDKRFAEIRRDLEEALEASKKKF